MGELYSAATSVPSELTSQNPHGSNNSSRHLSNLTLFSLWGLESTLSSSKKTKTKKLTSSKRNSSQFVHTGILFT